MWGFVLLTIIEIAGGRFGELQLDRPAVISRNVYWPQRPDKTLWWEAESKRPYGHSETGCRSEAVGIFVLRASAVKTVAIQDPSDPQRARVSGIVLNERAQPAVGITVQATPPGPIAAVLPHTQTDASGRFVLVGLLPGHTYLNAFDEEAFYPDATSNFWEGEGVAEVDLPPGGEALCRFRAAVRKVAEEWNPENLQGLPARHADYASGHDQFRPVGIPQALGILPCFVDKWRAAITATDRLARCHNRIGVRRVIS